MSRLTGSTTPPDDDRSPEAYKRRREEAFQEGLREGMLYASQDCVRKLFERRFGKIRLWVDAVIGMTFEVETPDRFLDAIASGSPSEEVVELMETCLFARQKAQTRPYPSAAPRP